MEDVKEEKVEYLYHYTSVETLLLILKNKTIAFNSLQNVDDLEECESQDIQQIGKVCYVSCWTNESTESIPMWSMYTPDMQGVRIKLKVFPFEKYNFKKGEYHFLEDCETYINYEKIYNDDKTTLAASQPDLIKVEYTNDEKLIYPKIKLIKDEMIKLVDGKIKKTKTISYSFKNIGKYKRKNWEFQKEYRYIINMSLWSMKELEKCKSYEEQQKLVDRLEDKKYQAPYKLFFLNLTDEALSEIEILLGPKINESQKEMVNLILNKYCPNAKILMSKLKIK